MKTVLIGYDLNRQGQDYKELIAAIKALGLWWHHLESTWLVKTDRTAAATRVLLREHLDSNDELVVDNVTARAAAWAGFNDRGGKWIKYNL